MWLSSSTSTVPPRDRRRPRARVALPEDAVIAADPKIFWLRSASRRAVVADCKSIPYGGDVWDEYVARIEDLGGYCTAESDKFAGLTVADVDALRERYWVTHVLLRGRDPKVAAVPGHWRLAHRVEPRAHPSMTQGWVVFEILP